MPLRTTVIKGVLNSLYATRLHRLLSGIAGGLGIILTLHRIETDPRPSFDPNGLLSVTPEFLGQVLQYLRKHDYDIIALDDMAARLQNPTARRFVVLTLDDGYKDNLTHALPLFERYEAPFTLYAVPDFADGTGELWWVSLEQVLRDNSTVDVVINDDIQHHQCHTPRQKQKACKDIYWQLRGLCEQKLRAAIRDLAARYHVDQNKICQKLCMNWQELKTIAAHPLCTIGVHTLSHPRLAKVSREEMEHEMSAARLRLEAEFNRACPHFSYPIGDCQSAAEREFLMAKHLGFTTAVTTRPAMLHAKHFGQLHALPRVSLNGNFQHLRYVETLLSGLPLALYNSVFPTDK